MHPGKWKYVDAVPSERVERLASAGSFEALISLVVEDARIVSAWTEPGRDRGLTDCSQPIFALELTSTGDALFNGPWGYRAQYWKDPWQGLAANGRLISALAPKLLGAVSVAASAAFGKLDVCSSLNAASAKIWIREASSILGDVPQALDVEPWTLEAKRGVQLARWGFPLRHLK